MNLIPLALAVLLAACSPSEPLMLDRAQWVCTKRTPIIIDPLVMECVEYRRLK